MSKKIVPFVLGCAIGWLGIQGATARADCYGFDQTDDNCCGEVVYPSRVSNSVGGDCGRPSFGYAKCDGWCETEILWEGCECWGCDGSCDE